jgi:hypothetical protein
MLDEIHALRETVRPWAALLGTEEAAIGGLERILEDGPECDWQRAELARAVDLAELQRRIMARVRREARCHDLSGRGRRVERDAVRAS